MNIKPFLYVIFLCLTVSFVVADAMGGAAGSGGSGFGVSLSSEETSSSGGEGPYLYGLKCYDNGQITFKQSPIIKPVVLEKEDGTTLTVSGEWKGDVFTSEEAEVNELGIYTIHDPKSGDKSVECPGLKFSCSLIELNLQSCFYEEEKVTAVFTLTGTGASVDDLQFEFRNQNSLLKYKKSSFSPELKDLQIKNNKNGEYELAVDVSDVSTLKITYPKCVGKKYIQSKIDCVKAKEPQKENNEENEIQFSWSDSWGGFGKGIENKQDNSVFSKIVFFFKRLFF